MDELRRSGTRNKAVTPKAGDTDRAIGLAVRDRRLRAGLTQQQVAEMVGVTYQQAHKYETGVNRISSGRLARLAEALECHPGDFFDDAGGGRQPQQERKVFRLVRNFLQIPEHLQDAVYYFVADVANGGKP